MRNAFTRRLAGTSARHPKTVIGIWLAVLAVSFAITGALLASALTTEIDFINTPESKESLELIENSSLAQDSFPENIIVQHPDLTVDDPEFQAVVTDIAGKVGGLDSVDAVLNVFDTGDQGLVSADRRTTILPVAIPEDKKDDVVDSLAIAEEANGADGFVVVQTGQHTLDHDFNEQSEKDLFKGEAIGITVALVILLFVFGALVASLIPIVLAVMSILIGLGVVALVGQAFELSFFVVNMMTMMGLAVGIDYSLFIVSRFREERAAGRDKIAAIENAGATANKAVFFSGLTVVLALIGLLIVPNTIFFSLGLGAIVVVLITVLQALTLLPAVLSLLGDRVNSLRLPFVRSRVGSEAADAGLWPRVARGVMARPVASLVAAVVILLAAATPVLTINTGFSGVSSLPDGFESKRGFVILGDTFSSGQSSPAQVTLESDELEDPAVTAAVARVSEWISANDAFGEPGPLQIAEEGGVALLQAPLAFDPQTEDAYTAVKELRAEVDTAFAGTPVSATVGGLSAQDVDFIDQLATFTAPVIAVVLLFSLVLLTLAFRSLLIPIFSIFLNLLSVGAAYGLLVLVLQQGIGNEIFGFTQVDQIEPWLPLFMFAVLFGLSMDYQVFLVSRIQERWNQTADNRTAVRWGVGTTARLITGAALIMVAVFGGFALGELVAFQQMGFGLAAAILIDATIVRTVLVPAVMTLLGHRNWYLPRSLGWIPDLSIEGVPAPAQPGGVVSGALRQ